MMRSAIVEIDLPLDSWDDLEEDRIDVEDERPSLTYWQDVWRRLKQNKLSIMGLIIIILLVLVAVFGPYFSPYTYSQQDLNYTSIPPRLEIRELKDDVYIYVDQTLKMYRVTADGKILGSILPESDDFIKKQFKFKIDEEDIVVDYNVKPFKILNSNGKEIAVKNKVFNKTFPFGTDDLGRDVLIRVIYGARISLIIGLVASIVNLTIGVIYGGIAGYFGGMVDNVMMRIIDIMRSVPRLLYVIIFMVIFGAGLNTVILTIGLVYWMGMARIVRGQVLSLKEQEFILAAKTIGARTFRILLKHLIPNAMGPIIVVAAMQIPSAIFTEAFLSFIGLGVSAPQSSWGTLCNDALSGLSTYPYQLFFPATAICITVLAFNFLGDGLRDSLDPRLRK